MKSESYADREAKIKGLAASDLISLSSSAHTYIYAFIHICMYDIYMYIYNTYAYICACVHLHVCIDIAMHVCISIQFLGWLTIILIYILYMHIL